MIQLNDSPQFNAPSKSNITNVAVIYNKSITTNFPSIHFYIISNPYLNHQNNSASHQKAREDPITYV